MRRHDVKRHRLLCLVLLGTAAFPQLAWANAGTPLMWAAALHLLFGNALIGLGEGLLLARIFSAPQWTCALVMTLANYVSAWLGFLFLQRDLVPMDLTNAWLWFWIMVVATYVMTLVLEWPFVAWCLRRTQGWFRRSLRASLVVQSASYVLLFGWYWMASEASLYTKMDVVEAAALSLPESVLVYYIDPADGDVYSRRLAGGTEHKAFELDSTGRNDRLFVRASTADADCWDLVARLQNQDDRVPRFVVVATNMHVEAPPDVRGTRTDPPDHEGTWLNFGPARQLGTAGRGQWEFWAGFWPLEGLQATHTPTGEQVRFSYETPFAAWAIRNLVHLPADKALFQLGNDQICAFDPATRRVALLWRGRGPVPVIAREAAGRPGDGAAPAE